MTGTPQKVRQKTGDSMASSQEMTASTLTAKCDYVRFSIADMHGILRGKTVPVRHADGILRDGMGFFIGTFFLLFPENCHHKKYHGSCFMYLSEILSKLQTCEVTNFMTFSDG